MANPEIYRRDQVVRGLILAGMYFVAGWAMLQLGIQTGWALVLIPASGVALGGLLCCGRRLWPGIWLGAFAFYAYYLNYWVPVSEKPVLNWVLIVFVMASAAAVQALWGSFLFNRFVRSPNPLDRVKDILIFIFLVAMVGSVVNASVNLTMMTAVGYLSAQQFAAEWMTWWRGDVLGVLLVAPLFLIFRQPLSFKWSPARGIEAGALFLLFFITSQVVFGDWLQYSHYPLVYMLFPCLVWAAYRFGHPGTVLATFLVSVAAVWGTIAGRGPFVLRSMEESFALLQIYLLVLTVMTLILSASATEAEEAQKQSTRFGRVLDESSNEIYLFDATTLKFVQVNRGAQENLGYSLAELQALTPLDIKPDFTRKDFEAILKPLRQGTENLVIFQTRHKRKDGTRYPVEARVQLSHSEVWPVFVVIIQDITEKKKTEEELTGYRHQLEQLVDQRTADLESAHRQLLHAEKLSATGKMAASMAHEFNNPIYGIRNVLEKILRRVKLEDNNKHFVKLALKECDRMATLIRKVLDFHSPSSDEKEWIDVHESIEDMILLVNKKFKERKIRLVKKFSEDMPCIEAVPDQFKQVMLNLLQNAEEAIPGRGGTITIATSAWNGKAQIQVKDTGAGISSDVMKNIFDPFFTTKPAVKGTGLGLSVTYGIIKKHGGEILVDSQPGQGTTFTIFLPVRHESTASLAD